MSKWEQIKSAKPREVWKRSLHNNFTILIEHYGLTWRGGLFHNREWVTNVIYEPTMALTRAQAQQNAMDNMERLMKFIREEAST